MITSSKYYTANNVSVVFVDLTQLNPMFHFYTTNKKTKCNIKMIYRNGYRNTTLGKIWLNMKVTTVDGL